MDSERHTITVYDSDEVFPTNILFKAGIQSFILSDSLVSANVMKTLRNFHGTDLVRQYQI